MDTKQIREATERGEFDNLPGAGKPIPNLDQPDETWWVKSKLARKASPTCPCHLAQPPHRVQILNGVEPASYLAR